MIDSAGSRHWDVVVIGAGAAGLMCGITAGRRGRSVLVLDHANKVGKKILMSGGGRCNFTNLYCTSENFLSANPHFCKSALSRYTPWDFIGLVDKHQVPYHEKKLGQLFCDRSSKDIVRILLAECEAAGVAVRTHSAVDIEQLGPPHRLSLAHGKISCESLVIATGGYPIPRMGATGFGLDFARSLGLAIQPTRAALVPFVLDGRKLKQIEGLAGVSLDTFSQTGDGAFRESMLFTHKGLSGPAMLQVSSYWQPGDPVAIDLLPDFDLVGHLRALRAERSKVTVKNVLAELLPRRMAQRWVDLWLDDLPMTEVGDEQINLIAKACKPWMVWPAGTEGYATAEVMIGGVDTAELSSKTMVSHAHPGLYFIGEVVDVTGQLGGHNFQWAWASGHAAGLAV